MVIHAYNRILDPGRLPSKVENKRHRRKSDPESISEQDETTSFNLTGFYVLKVLFIDMTISLGDVGTDFWQVRGYTIGIRYLVPYIHCFEDIFCYRTFMV